jgi:hypothetical protein
MARGRAALVLIGVSFLVLGFSVAGGRLALSGGAAQISQPPAPDAPWAGAIERIDAALAAGDAYAADRAWHDAYMAALGSRRWEAMIAVGDASVRIGGIEEFRQVATARARQTYLIALFRARRAGSLDGVQRAGRAFENLGDRAAAEQSMRVAETLAAREAQPVRLDPPSGGR